MEALKDRITGFISNYLHISVRKFEENCGLPYSTIANIKKKGPSAEILMKINDKYPDLNLNWLICGKGNMLIEEEPPKEETPQTIPFQTVNIGNWAELVDLIKQSSHDNS